MPEIESNESLMIWLINEIAQKSGNHAILKGGMVLRLLDCPRYTNDLDYVFVPFRSKKEIVPYFEKVLSQLEGAKTEIIFHSTSVRIKIHYKDYRTQIEANVMEDCKSQAIDTEKFSTRNQQFSSRVIRVMSLDWALANKLAAWNERGLVRDIYDIYFIHQILGIMPDLEILKKRLNKIHYSKSKKSLNQSKTMSLPDFLEKLNQAATDLTFQSVEKELADAMTSVSLSGLDYKIKIGIKSLVERIQNQINIL